MSGAGSKIAANPKTDSVYRATAHKFVGEPDGPIISIPEFGCDTRAFLERREDLETNYYRDRACLMYHVPMQFRGVYRPAQLANFDRTKEYDLTFEGYCRCQGSVKTADDPAKLADPQCLRKAMNMSGFCPAHGGKIHPLDQRVQGIIDPATMSRAELLSHGFIDVDDLEDEELLRGMCRKPDGTFNGSNKPIPKAMYDKLVSRLFERANEKMRETLIDAVDALGVIIKGDAFEASDRIRASDIIITRVLGKPRETIDLNVGIKPYEQILGGIAPLTREESRRLRAIEAGSQPKIIDGEIIDDEETECEVSFNNGQIAEAAVSDVHGDRSVVVDEANAAGVQGTASDVLRTREEKPLTAKELKERISKARNVRFAARTQGRTEVGPGVIYVRTEEQLWEDGKRTGIRRIRYLHPEDMKLPSTQKAKETRARNYQRRKQ